MNQHFVPEFYLKNFSSNERQIFVYDKVIHKSFSSSISSVASRKGFYDNSSKESIENEIGVLEGKTAIVLTNLIESLTNNQFIKIEDEQKSLLIQFIWLQMNRTIEARIDFGATEPLLLSKLSNEQLKVDVNEILKHTENIDNHIRFLSSSKENTFALEELKSRNFIIVKNDTDVDFLTSDEPIIKHLHWEIDPRVYEIFLPITPRFGIWIIPKNLYQELDKFDKTLYLFSENQNILFYNFHHVYRSFRQIFSLTDNFEYVRKIFEKAPNFGNINKQRWD